MLIDYKHLGGQSHHSLATKDASAGGFTIARLKINTNDAALQYIKQVKLT
jgi:hypothetical protein